MTLPAGYPLSMSQIATELGLALPLSLNHAWVIALAGKGALPVSFSDLLGKTGRFDGSVFANAGQYGNDGSITLNTQFFGGTLTTIATFDSNVPAGVPKGINCNFSVAPNWASNVFFKNNTTGISITLPQINSTLWGVGTGGYPANLIRPGQTDNYTILPSN